MRDPSRGVSLVEAVASLALVGGVLVSVAGLFVLGGQQVRSGRSGTEALSVARTIVEEMETWAFSQTYSAFGLDGDASSYTIDTRTSPRASRWQAMLDARLQGGYALIRIESLAGGAAAPPLSEARAIRVRVAVHWDEGPRHRRVDLGAVRL